MSTTKDYPFPQSNLEHPSFTLLANWWERLETDNGERARLRRASNLTEVMMSPAFHTLLWDLRRAGYGIAEYRFPKLAVIAGLSARVRVKVSAGLATRMGTVKPGSSAPVVSELRLRRLLACDDIEEFYSLLRRALSMLDDQANLTDLAATVWHWSPLDDKRPYNPHRRLAYDYYAAAPIRI